MRGGQTVRIVPTDLGGRYFALCGFWEPQTTRSIVRTRRQGLMIDVGANFGYFSALWLRFPGARVIAIEPSSAYTTVLRENLADFVERARLFEGVVGETNGVANFAGEGMLGHIVPCETLGSYRVPMTTLSQLLAGEASEERIEVLKIDAEGYDLTILNANRNLFQQQRVGLVLWEKADTPEEQGFVTFIRSVGYHPVLDSSMLGFTRT
jgi:FkbM family methyltransferase